MPKINRPGVRCHVVDSELPLTLLSICMAVRNGEATIEHAVRSITRQTFADWELIIIDDGSIDQTVDVIEKIADTRIKLFRNPRSLGLAACLNRALSKSNGKFIGRMDADDVSFPDRFERQLHFLKQHPEVDLVGGQALMFRRGWDLVGMLDAPLDHEHIIRAPGNSLPVFHPTWMGKADWFARYNYDERYLRAQDFEMLLRASPHSTYANIPDVILGYRFEKGSLAKRRASRRFQRLAIAKNRASLRTSYGKAISTLWIKDVADIILSSIGFEFSGSRNMPLSSVVERWCDLVDSLE